MHAQQLPGGALPPALPLGAMPHPSLAGGPSNLAALSSNASNGPTPPGAPPIGMLTKQELMLHNRPDDAKSGGPHGPNDENRHVSTDEDDNDYYMKSN
jgi:hypothetical protein